MHDIKSAVSAHSCGQQARCQQECGAKWNLLEGGQRHVCRQTLHECADAFRTQAVVSKAEIILKTCMTSKVPCQNIPVDSKLDVTRNVGQMWNLRQGGQGRVCRQTRGECTGAIRAQVVASKAETTEKTCITPKVPLSVHSCGQRARCHQECGFKSGTYKRVRNVLSPGMCCA